MPTLGGAGRRLHLRCFLEGIEVPIIACTVQATVGAPATASVQLVPSDRLLELKPRTLIHVFYWDSDAADQAVMSTIDNPNADPLDEFTGYKLFFGGEVVGVSLGKTPMSRQIVLQCLDWSSYWDTCYQLMVSWGPNGNFLYDSAAMWAGGSSMFNDIIDSHSSVLNDLLRSGATKGPKTPGLQKVRGLMGGVIRMLEAMGGVPGHSKGANDFFAIGELMRHLTQQIVTEQDDDTALKLFSNKAFWAWLNKGGTSLGQLITFRDLLKLFCQWVYYEVVPITSPMYVPRVVPKTTPPKTIVLQVPAAMKAQLLAIQNEAKQRINMADNFGKAPQVTKVRPIDAVFSDISQIKTKVRTAATRSVPAEAKTQLKRLSSLLDRIGETNANFKAADGAYYLEYPLVLHVAALWSDVVDIINIILGVPTERRTIGVKQEIERDRLQTQVLRPDCFFAPAPRCNVFFPDQYTQFNYQRSFLQEPTRLRLQTEWAFIGGGELLGTFHYAPSYRAMKENAKTQGFRSIRALLPWEKFTGVLPKFESIHEVNFAANKRQKSIDKNLKEEAKSYSQRAANFNFYKYRFAARSAEITARLSPQVVVGFPGLVIERPFILNPDEISRKLAENHIENVNLGADSMLNVVDQLAEPLKAPTQYQGMIQAVSHTADQSGGQTQVSMSHARTHRTTEDDFLGLIAEEVVKGLETEIVETVYDVAELLAAGKYREIDTLIKMTFQQDDTDAAIDELIADEQGAPQAPSPDLTDSERPSGLDPHAASLKKAAIGTYTQAPVVNLKAPIQAPKDRTLSGFYGLTNVANLDDTTTTARVPRKDGDIKPGSRGPNGGTITQIIVLGDGEQVKLYQDKGGGMSKATKTVTVTATKTQIIQPNQSIDGSEVDPNSTPYTIQTVRVKEKRQVPVFQKDKQEFYAWRRVVVHEKVQRKQRVKKVPVEEVLRPPWFSAIYSNLFIGQHVYTPFFGCGSMVDESVFSLLGDLAAQGNTDTSKEQRHTKLLNEVRGADGDLGKIATILQKYTDEGKKDPKTGKVVGANSLSSIPSIEQAADRLAWLYGEVRRRGLDAHRFIYDYTKRPIATLQDIFGSADLEYTKSGTTFQVRSGTSGFHSLTVGDYKDLEGLLDNPDEAYPHFFDKGKTSPIDKSLDPRPARREAVLNYIRDLGVVSGSLGVGVRG